MIEKIRAIKKNHVAISLITAFLAVFLAWGIFIAQYLFSDTVTLARHGDEARYTLPAFIEMGEHIANGVIDGIDTLTANGSNSIHLDGMEWYIPYRIFAYLGYLTSPLFMFMAFLAIHMFVNMYFTQRLCYKYLNMSSALALLIAISIISLSFQAVWFHAFFVIMSLVTPLIYGIITMLKSNSKLSCLLSSFLFVIALTSGYSLISAAMALTIFLFSLFYSILYKINDCRRIFYRSLLSAILGVGVCLPYYIIILLSNQNSSTKSMMTLSQAIAQATQPSMVIPKLFFFSDEIVPGEWVLCIGLIWSYLAVLFILSKTTSKMDIKEKIIFGIGIIGTLLFLLIDFKDVLPFDKWYYMIPAFGGLRLRRRYMLIFIPLLFISFGIALKNCRKKPERKTLLIVSIVYVIFHAILFFVAKDAINKDAFIIELILTGTAIYFGITNGFLSKKFLMVFSCIIFCYGVNTLYAREEVTASESFIKSRCIAFDSDKQVALDNFVNTFSKQDIYKYVALEEGYKDTPLYIPGNYGWYHKQKNALSNYSKYPLHGPAISDAYRTALTLKWHNSFDINYLYDTRADFAVLTKEIKDKTPINFVFDFSVTPLYFNDTMFCAKLEKYIPRHYTNGQELVLDKNNSLDNGYFYCPTLTNNNIENFETDNYTYFKISINADTGSEIQYSMFPNEKFSYYIDGEAHEPVKDYNLAYFNLTPGHHSIEIRYRDTKQIVIYWIFTIYYSLILLGGICYIIGSCRKHKHF